MNRVSRLLLPVFAAAALCAAVRCSSDYAGGTETDNPDVIACAALIFGAFPDSALWNIRAYVPGGLERLDSAGVYTGGVYRHPTGTLTKQWVERTDTVIDSMRIVTYTIFIDDTLLLRDTIVTVDTVFVNDTIVRANFTYDTSTVVEGSDTTRIIVKSLSTDSVFVIDTVMVPDTFVRVDTLFVRDTTVLLDTLPANTTQIGADTLPSPISYDPDYTIVYASVRAAPSPTSLTITYNFSDTTGVYLVTNNLSETVYPIPPDKLLVQNETTTVLVTKELSSASGATVTETFGDIDGDGQLFGGGYQELRFNHTYNNLAGDTLAVAADISSGVDGSFSYTADNSVLSLFRRIITPRRLENVTYEGLSRSATVDTLLLKVIESISDSSLSIFSRAYLLRRGTNTAVGNDDSLKGWSGTAIYHGGDISRIDMEMRLDQTAASGSRPGSARLRAVIWCRNGSIGVLDSIQVELGSGWMTGSYRKDGEIIPFDITRTQLP